MGTETSGPANSELPLLDQDTVSVTDAYRRGIPPPTFSFVNLKYNTGSKLAYININKCKNLQWMTYEFK